MLNIEHLRLRLPTGFEHRAVTIARLVGEGLANISLNGSGTVDRLSVGPVRIGVNATDRQVAQDIVTSIATKIRGVL